MKRILLIEDNLEMRENTAEILELANYEITTAENGKTGVKLAKELKPDLIICDIMMPELDGYGVLHMLSKNPDTAGIPFIFLTAKAEKTDFRKGMSLGADDYLTKPFEETDLLSAVEGRIKRSELFKANKENSKEVLEDFLNKASGLNELKELSKDRKTKQLKKKTVIFHEGDFPNTLFFVKSGKVKSFKINEDGKEYITGLYNEGDFFGYMALIEGNEYKETTETLEETELTIIPKDDFISLLYKNREVAAAFIKMLAKNVNEKEQRLIELAYDTVRKRVADALLLLKEKYHKEEGEFKIAIARDDLASIVGTATESVIRMLSEFKQEGLIEIKSSEITILKPQELESIRF